MEVLVLKSIRLSKKSLTIAKELGHDRFFPTTSDVLRLAIWLGLKLLQPRLLHEFMRMMWQEEFNGVNYSAADVLRTAGDSLENLKSLE